MWKLVQRKLRGALHSLFRQNLQHYLSPKKPSQLLVINGSDLVAKNSKKREKTLIKNGHTFITKPETRTIVPRISPKRQSHGCKANLFCGSQGSQTKSSRRNSSGKVVVHQHAQNMRSTVAKGANVANTGVDASELQTSGTDLAVQ